MDLLLLAVIIGLKILLCKGLALGIVLLLFWIKGRQLRFNSDEWGNFFVTLPERTLQRYAVFIYLIAELTSSLVSYFILELAGYRYSIAIALLIFVVSILITTYKWHTKGKAYLLRRYQKIPDTILDQQKQKMEKKQNE